MTNAREFAIRAHGDQVDKLGRPYIEHLERVVHLTFAIDGTFEYQNVAWLHDILEDTDVTADDLERAGFDFGTVKSVIALTHRPHESRADYYERVKADFMATEVKIADVRDNSDPRRLMQLDDETIVRLVRKYGEALNILEGEI